jgi:hypothetical protein
MHSNSGWVRTRTLRISAKMERENPLYREGEGPNALLSSFYDDHSLLQLLSYWVNSVFLQQKPSSLHATPRRNVFAGLYLDSINLIDQGLLEYISTASLYGGETQNDDHFLPYTGHDSEAPMRSIGSMTISDRPPVRTHWTEHTT